MRCYFLKNGHIASVEFLEKTNDAGLIEEARRVFEARGRPRGAEGFEVWDGARLVYRFSEMPAA